jgi:hypothetical protein
LSKVIIPTLPPGGILFGLLNNISLMVSTHFVSIPLLIAFQETSMAKTRDNGVGGLAQYSYFFLKKKNIYLVCQFTLLNK